MLGNLAAQDSGMTVTPESAANWSRLDYLVEHGNTQAELDEFLALCEWSATRERERRVWRAIALESAMAGKQ